MKKSVLFLLAIVVGFTAFAQKQPLKIGVKAGITFPKIITSDDAVFYDDSGAVRESKINTSFYFGATVDIPLGKGVLFQPGFSLIGKGSKVSYSSTLLSTRNPEKINILYFEVPANAVFNIPVGKNNVFLGLGPYFAYALSGTTRYDLNNSDTVEADKQNVKFGSDKDFKRFDIGANVLAGYQLANGLNIHGGVGASALKISNLNATYLKARNLVYSIGLGFSF